MLNKRSNFHKGMSLIGLNLNIRSLFIITLIQIFATNLQAKQVDHSLEKFAASTSDHRVRLPRVAVNYVRLNPDKFPLASRNLKMLREYFEETHDAVKEMTVAELKSMGYPYEHDVVTRLYYFHGLNENQMSPSQLKEFRELRDNFNSIEKVQKKLFFQKRGIPANAPLIKEFSQIEIIVDLTDVGMFRQTEFGLQGNTKYNGANFLLRSGYPESWVAMSREIEENYMHLVWVEDKPTNCASVLN